jgi:hypothetical protein
LFRKIKLHRFITRKDNCTLTIGSHMNVDSVEPALPVRQILLLFGIQ